MKLRTSLSLKWDLWVVNYYYYYYYYSVAYRHKDDHRAFVNHDAYVFIRRLARDRLSHGHSFLPGTNFNAQLDIASALSSSPMTLRRD